MSQTGMILNQLLDTLDEAYGELLADSRRDGPRCLLLTRIEQAIAAGREALAQKDEQEPFVWMWNLRSDPIHKGYYEKHPASYGIDVSSQKYIWTPLYTAPPKRKPLTEDEIRALWARFAQLVGGTLEFARAIEQAHGIGEAK